VKTLKCQLPIFLLLRNLHTSYRQWPSKEISVPYCGQELGECRFSNGRQRGATVHDHAGIQAWRDFEGCWCCDILSIYSNVLQSYIVKTPAQLINHNNVMIHTISLIWNYSRTAKLEWNPKHTSKTIMRAWLGGEWWTADEEAKGNLGKTSKEEELI